MALLQVLDVDWFKGKGLLDEDAVKVRQQSSIERAGGGYSTDRFSQNTVREDLPLLNPVGEYAGLDMTSADLADPHKRAERAVKEKEAGNQVRFACFMSWLPFVVR